MISVVTRYFTYQISWSKAKVRKDFWWKRHIVRQGSFRVTCKVFRLSERDSNVYLVTGSAFCAPEDDYSHFIGERLSLKRALEGRVVLGRPFASKEARTKIWKTFLAHYGYSNNKKRKGG